MAWAWHPAFFSKKSFHRDPGPGGPPLVAVIVMDVECSPDDFCDLARVVFPVGPAGHHYFAHLEVELADLVLRDDFAIAILEHDEVAAVRLLDSGTNEIRLGRSPPGEHG